LSQRFHESFTLQSHFPIAAILPVAAALLAAGCAGRGDRRAGAHADRGRPVAAAADARSRRLVAGAGPIAIHGTNAPWSIGKAVSNGCIRLPNATLKKVFAQALNGTPVLIRR
jgi:hypothetical protein